MPVGLEVVGVPVGLGVVGLLVSFLVFACTRRRRSVMVNMPLVVAPVDSPASFCASEVHAKVLSHKASSSAADDSWTLILQ